MLSVLAWRGGLVKMFKISGIPSIYDWEFWIGLHMHKKEMHAPAIGISEGINNVGCLNF